MAPRPDRRRTPSTEPRSITFAKFVQIGFRRRLAEGTAAKVHKVDYSRIRRFVTPLIGRRPMAAIEAADVQGVLTRIARENVNTAEALRRQLVKIFDEAITEGIREGNPVRSEEIIAPKRRKRASGEDRSVHA